MLAKSIPVSGRSTRCSRRARGSLFKSISRACIWAILPATLLWGASFPLALAPRRRAMSDPGRLVGGVYAANTAGAIVGALAFSMILIPWIGTQQSRARADRDFRR